MMPERIGYARVSSLGQSLAIQLERLRHVGCDTIYEEKASGTKDDRPRLAACLEYVRKGDTLLVTRIDRLARSTQHLCEIAAMLDRKGVALEVIDQRIETATPAGRLHFQMLGAIAEFETALRKERQMEGIARAQRWGGGTLSSSDGQRFPVRGKVRNARALPRYFGYG
jgi:hypothetical protein